MIPFFGNFSFCFQRPKTPEELQREKLAQDAKELKDYLSRMTPEVRSKFWADIEGKGDDREKQTPAGS
jgi:hypothetical protein